MNGWPDKAAPPERAQGPISAGNILIPLVFASDFRNKATF
jgi:hypothetical protein